MSSNRFGVLGSVENSDGEEEEDLSSLPSKTPSQSPHANVSFKTLHSPVKGISGASTPLAAFSPGGTPSLGLISGGSPSKSQGIGLNPHFVQGDAAAPPTTAATNKARATEFAKSMKVLNAAFTTSCQSAVSRDPSHSLTPLVKDYLHHSQGLLEEGNKEQHVDTTTTSAPIPTKSLNHGDSDRGSLDRKKKRTQLSSSDEDEDSRNSVSEKSETNFKTRRLNGCKMMSEDQINKCDDLKALKLQLKSCLAKLGSTEVELKTLEIERNMEREDFRRKENDVQSVNAAFKEETYKKILELLESELSCAVCNEVFIQATVVDCGHTFCSFCISDWARKKQECPICQKAFRNRSRHFELENYISRLFESFSSEIAAGRKAIITDREEQVKKAAEDGARIQERVVDGAVVGQAQPARLSLRATDNANNNGSGPVAVDPPPIPPRSQPAGHSSRPGGNNIPVVTLSDTDDEAEEA